jgi:proliferating cell nuclear antigen
MEEEIGDTMMCFSTIQGSVLRSLIESIKEILVDITIFFSPTDIRSTSIDGNKIACIFFIMEASKFEYYKCDDTFSIGINMQSIYRLIKTISNNDTVTMSIKKNEMHRLKIVISNTEKQTRVISYLKLLDIDQEIISIPDIEFDHIITLPCIDFQRYCKDMMVISNTVTITCEPKLFTLSCEGDFAEQVIEIREFNSLVNNMKKKHNTNTTTTKTIVESILKKEPEYEHEQDNVPFITTRGVFSLKYINLFIKSSSLCSTVELYLKNDYPLVLIYKIGSLGKLQFCLAPSLNS